MFKRFIDFIRRREPQELFLVTFTLILTALIGVQVESLGYTRALADATSNLMLARFVFDSLTPGLSQIGFWNQLLHLVLAPFTQVPWLFTTGLAGLFVIYPMYILSVVLLYRICLKLTKNSPLSLAGAMFYVLNPYISFYANTPMSEVMFMGFVIFTTHAMLSWLEEYKLRYLLQASIWISFASISRFEGLMLIPFCFLVILVSQIAARRKGDYIRGLLLLFSLLAVCGLGFTLIHGYYFGGNPLAFASQGLGSYSTSTGGRAFSLPTFKFLVPFTQIVRASLYQMGQWFLPLALVSGVLSLAISPRRKQLLVAYLLLASPLFFVFLSLSTGRFTVDVPEILSDQGTLFRNERYALTWYPMVCVAAIMLAGALQERSKRTWSLFLSRSFSSLFVIALFGFIVQDLYRVVRVEHFIPIRHNLQFSLRDGRSQMNAALRAEYDFGKILIRRYGNDEFMMQAGLPLRTFIYEGNYRYYQAALVQPWFYARWIYVSEYSYYEKALATLRINKDFTSYYTLVKKGPNEWLYKVNESAVRQALQRQGIDPNTAPSLNPGIHDWEPPTVDEADIAALSKP